MLAYEPRSEFLPHNRGIRVAVVLTVSPIFLALFLCVLGGLLGVGAGYGAAEAMTRFASWETAVSPEAVAAAIGFSAAVGLFFGIWPARRAALLDPIDALRYE